MRLFFLVVSLVMVSAALLGQAANGTITGIVSDPAGAVVANASVEVRNTDTGVVYPTVTTASGEYTVTQLPVGPYQVTVRVMGFKTYTHSNIQVTAASIIREDPKLEIGATGETVTVTAEASLLKTESGDVAHNITLQQLDELPVLGIGGTNAGSSGIRNPFNSTVFLPGVVYTPNYVMIVNGSPNQASAFRLEGMDNTNHTVSYALQENQPSADAIQEVAVQTSNYAAEFGTTSGGVFNITMKSGTNQFHGSGYDYFVNEDLNAGYPFSYTNPGFTGGKYRPRNRRNDFGGTLGGPVWIPGLYNGRNKTFFFYSYEYYKESQGLSFTDTLPAPAYQNGDFSAISPNGGANFNPGLGVTANAIATDALGRPVFANEIYDPLSRGVANGVGIANPFPNNVIPPNRFDPTAVAIQNLLPPTTGALVNNYTGFNAGRRNTTIPSVKFDQILGSKAKLSFYWGHTLTDSQFSVPNGSDNGLPTLISTARGTFIGSQMERLNFDYTVTPTLLAHVGIGYSQISFFDDSPYTTGGGIFNCSSIHLIGCEGSFNFPTINVNASGLQNTAPNGATQLGGMTQLGNALAHTHTRTERPSTNANVTWVHGSHTYKAGMELWLQAQITAPPTGVGLTYSTPTMGNTGAGATGIPASLVTGAYTEGFPYANFLLGDVVSATQYAPVDARMFKQQWALFVQDSWKATRRLTLDYGLRWDYGTAAREEYGRSANLGLNVPNPAAGGRLGAPIFEATCGCTFVSNYPYALGPRLGVAYQATPKTVIRGGWGFVYGFPADINLQNTADLTSAPAGVNAFVNIQTPGAMPQPSWPNFNPGQTPLPGQITGFSGFSFLDPNASRPGRQNQWSLGVQREITPNTVIEATYIGNRGVWWPGGPYGYLNQVLPAAFAAYGLSPYSNPTDNLLLGSALKDSAVINRLGNIVPYSGYSSSNTLLNALRPYPQFSTIGVTNSATGGTWYESLQMKGTKRLSHGLQVNGTFTWSKSLTEIRPILAVNSIKSLTSFDQPFLFNANILYTTQRWFSNPIVSTVVRDWQLGAFLQYGSGFPLPPPAATNTNYLGGSEDFRVPGQPLFIKNLNCGCINPYTDQVLNPAAWTVPANGTFGPATGTYYGDFRTARYPSENFNIGRNFRVGKEGRYNLQIRAEFVNIFNRLELGAPSTSNPTAPVTHNNFNQLNAGFGVINETVAGFQTAPSITGNPLTGASTGQLYQNPRTGTLIARFSF
ncbi:MAG TPA: carboxypeptidase regulatory-like domain-containing protein [Bryobacteraceae bacterium]|nr:carboxypeptidase regulatory-like domain-containing protein [Bryobacteraceae bacterium]